MPKPTPVINPSFARREPSGIERLMEKTKNIINGSKKEKSEVPTSTTNEGRESQLSIEKKKLELECQLEMKNDECLDLKKQVKELTEEKVGKPLKEKQAITKRIMEKKKKMLDVESDKIRLEEELEALKTPSHSDIGERLGKLASSSVATVSAPPVTIPIITEKKIKKKGKNNTAADELKKSLKKKNKKPRKESTEEPSDESTEKPSIKRPKMSNNETLTQPKVPQVPSARIPKKIPKIDLSPKKADPNYVQPLDQVLKPKKVEKPKVEPKTIKAERAPSIPKEDAPDIIDPETTTTPPTQKRRPGRAVGDLRNPSNIPMYNGHDPRVILEKATRNFRAGMLSKVEYEDLRKKLERMIHGGDAARQRTADPRQAARSETKPWYNHTDGRIQVDETKKDYRDTMWIDQNPDAPLDPIDEWNPPSKRQAPPPPPAPTVRPHPRDIDRRDEVPSYYVTDDDLKTAAPPSSSAPAPPPVAAPPAIPDIAGLDLKKILAMVQKPATPPPPTQPVVPAAPYVIIDTPVKETPKVVEQVMEPDSKQAPVLLTENENDFDDSKLPRIEFNDQMCKIRNDSLIKRLYSGMPCTACGLRFLQSQTTRYADHLDFHYRQNRKEKEGFVATNRPWYYSATDWLQYEEIEDAEQRDKGMFDPSKPSQSGTKGDETAEGGDEEETAAKHTLPITAGDNKCAVCHEPFESFFHQEEEEWHYRDCVLDPKTGKLMHVHCMDDAANIMEESALQRNDSISSIEEEETPKMETEEEVKQEPTEEVEMETNIANDVKSEKEEDLYGDLAAADCDEMITA